ncbi:15185_t:CDS:1, partial [Dentiscutata erythropus]
QVFAKLHLNLEIEPKQFRDWHSKKNELMLARPRVRRMNAGSRPKYPELEVELNNWVCALRAELKVVTCYMVQVKAKNLAQKQRFLSLYPDISTFQ